MKDIHVSHATEDDQLIRLGVSNSTNMTGITGGAASFEERSGELGDPVTSEANEYRNNTKESPEDDKASDQTHITGVTLNKNKSNH
eukprot:10383528-Ditylum_brightwellii.AAC.1